VPGGAFSDQQRACRRDHWEARGPTAPKKPGAGPYPAAPAVLLEPLILCAGSCQGIQCIVAWRLQRGK